jgi:hypothetical protein
VPLDPRHYLGVLCPREHRYEGQDRSLRLKSNSGCLECRRTYRYGSSPSRDLATAPKPRRRGQRRHARAAAVASNGYLTKGFPRLIPSTCSIPSVQECPAGLPAPGATTLDAPPTPGSANGHHGATGDVKPELPPYIENTCYLGDPCPDTAHRYRNSPWSLRFLADDVCVQCLWRVRTPRESSARHKEGD